MEVSGDTVLIADDDPYIVQVLSDRLESVGFRVLLTDNGKEAMELLDRNTPQAALLDIAMPEFSGIELLKELRAKGKDIPIIMITAYGSIDLAVQAMREGAYDFIAKPFEPDHITLVVKKALEQQSLRRKVELLTDETDKRYHLLVGQSPKMQQAADAARRAAKSKSTMLLLGESGTGKEIFARNIHNWSERKEKPFVAINCVGLSKELLESELFGHEKGAFTGAHQLKKGKIELAHGGTVFLDEVGDVSPEIQAKLLRFLQEREFERVGGIKSIAVDVRIVAATNCDLAALVEQASFREDLYHRLNVIAIKLPPLRDRKEDISELCRYFLARLSAETKRNFRGITEAALGKLVAYHWPGNVRELANVIEQAVVLGQTDGITASELPLRILSASQAETSRSCSYRQAVDNFRREVVLRALAQTQGNRLAAAKALGLHEKSLLRLIRTLQIN